MIRVTDANGNVKMSGPISGSGTANYLVRWSAALAQQNSRIIDGIANGDLTIQKNGVTARTITVPDASIEVAGVRETLNGSATARLGATYLQVATGTVTDPTPAEGRGFEVLVRNGTATIGGTAYATAGTYVHRLYHSGAWSNYVYPHLDAAWTWTGVQTLSNATASTSTTTGALVVTGGVGIGGSSFFGGPINITTASSISVIRQSSTTNVNGALQVRNDRNATTHTLEFAVPGSAATPYGLIVADSAVMYSQRSFRIVSDNAAGEIILGVGASGGTRNLTCGPSTIGFLGATAIARTSLAAPTGTATRTTFDTATVTLPQLAERVKAIIDDLRAYGLEG